ncbi:MFS transporter [Castellaniella hirudinis]|uniref:MFS transporter n=1 Tax=Castellaniella hirudinis TaxID=1144617 RepID=A0ABV8S514_9BURK
MSIRVWLLALTTFVTGLAENITVGILPALSGGLHVTLGVAGQLTTIFSLGFAAAAPAAPLFAGRWPLRNVLGGALLLFALCNVAAALAPGYEVLLAARIGMAAASALTCWAATLLATRLVPAAYRGRAIGVIFMGISGSLVLGVPVGMLLAEALGWRSVFAGLAGLACVALCVTRPGLPDWRGGERIAASVYVRHLRDGRLAGAQAVSVLMIAGHFTVFAYLAPYAVRVAMVPEAWLALLFAAFGVAGVSGGYLGGWLADALGPRRAVVLTPLLYLSSLLALPWCASTPWAFVPAMMVWGGLSWMISPVVQSYLAAAGPATLQAGLSLNLSAMHLGVGLGTAAGGLVVTYASLSSVPWTGAALAAVAVMCAATAAWSTNPGRGAEDAAVVRK